LKISARKWLNETYELGYVNVGLNYYIEKFSLRYFYVWILMLVGRFAISYHVEVKFTNL